MRLLKYFWLKPFFIIFLTWGLMGCPPPAKKFADQAGQSASDDAKDPESEGDGGSAPIFTQPDPIDPDPVVIAPTPVILDPISPAPTEVVVTFEIGNQRPHLVGQEIKFLAEVTAGKADRFEWNFGDRAGGVGLFPLHAYGIDGKFQVTLKAFKANQLIGEHSKEIIINAPLTVGDVTFDCNVFALSGHHYKQSLDCNQMSAVATIREIDSNTVKIEKIEITGLEQFTGSTSSERHTGSGVGFTIVNFGTAFSEFAPKLFIVDSRSNTRTTDFGFFEFKEESLGRGQFKKVYVLNLNVAKAKTAIHNQLLDIYIGHHDCAWERVSDFSTANLEAFIAEQKKICQDNGGVRTFEDFAFRIRLKTVLQ